MVITGRTADPSLFLAPMAAHYGWALDDWTLAGRGTLVGHLLECAGQVTGGYFAEPGLKDVPNLAQLGFPWCDVDAEGNGTLGKVAGTGGAITLRTVKEQLLYEVTDPGGYITPDAIADWNAYWPDCGVGLLLTQFHAQGSPPSAPASEPAGAASSTQVTVGVVAANVVAANTRRPSGRVASASTH